MDPIIRVFLLIGFVVVGIPMILVGVLIVRSILKVRHDASPVGQQQLVAEAQRWLEEQVPRLAPWTPERVYDISTLRDWRMVSFTSEKTWGTVKSFNVQNELILAYYTLLSWNKRHCLVRSTADQWHMTWEGPTIDMHYNNEPFGSWTSDGVLHDAAGNAVGFAKRLWVVEVQGLPTTFEGRRYDVMLRDRLVGRVLAQHGLKDIQLGMFLSKLPIIDVEGLEPDEDARRWLYALACIELVAYNELKISSTF